MTTSPNQENAEGEPQPASAPLDQEAAERVAKLSDGRLRPYQGGDGNWYVYDTEGGK